MNWKGIRPKNPMTLKYSSGLWISSWHPSIDVPVQKTRVKIAETIDVVE